MTQEDKELLLKDICARLPYGVKVKIGNDMLPTVTSVRYAKREVVVEIYGWYNDVLSIEQVKPYLRSMSSMTEEEKKIMRSCGFELVPYDMSYTGFGNKNYVDEVSFRFMDEFINSHHFDYRGLISMGLALEAPEGMYKLK